MWYLTILYLYVSINTCCCITNGIKKGVTEVLDVWKLCLCGLAFTRAAVVVLSSEGQPLSKMWVTLSRLCSRAGDGARGRHSNPHWHPLLLVHVSTGNPDILHNITGNKTNFSQCSPTKHYFWNTLYHRITVFTLFFSLQERCLIWILGGSRSCRLVSLLQRHKVVESILMVHCCNFQ